MKLNMHLAFRAIFLLSILGMSGAAYIRLAGTFPATPHFEDVLSTAIDVFQVFLALAAFAFAFVNCRHQQDRLCEIEELNDIDWNNGVRFALQRETERVTIWTQLCLQGCLLACMFLTDVTSVYGAAALATSSLVISGLTGFTVFAVISAQKLMPVESTYWSHQR